MSVIDQNDKYIRSLYICRQCKSNMSMSEYLINGGRCDKCVNKVVDIADARKKREASKADKISGT